MNRSYSYILPPIILAILLCCCNGFAQSVSFSYTGSVQTYIVPKDVSSIAIDMSGAAGGSTSISEGGAGGRVQCSLAVTPGDAIYLYMGGAGHNSKSNGAAGGYNGGGAGSEDAGGGGGATDIRYRSTALSNRVVVAGGGGGACGPILVAVRNYNRGGNGGGLTGEIGYYNGAAKKTDTTYNKPGKGGDGYSDYVGGGGGGGGYQGGAGGNESGGSGGSSYTDPLLATSVIHTQGYNAHSSGALIITPVIVAKEHTVPQPAQTVPEKADSVFKPHGSVYGSVFFDYTYKAHGDTSLGVRSARSQYAGLPASTSMFQFRRIYLGYNYELSERFSTEFLMSAEDDYSLPVNSYTGDLLKDNKFAPFIKLANLRWKNIFNGTDLVIGQQYTPAFHYTSEAVFAYRDVQRTIADVYHTPEADMGIALQGHLLSDNNFGYHLMVGNGSGAIPASSTYKWFYADVNYKFFDQRLMVDLYADYKRLAWTADWHSDRQMSKLFIAYTVPRFTIGFESFINTLRNDDIATKWTGDLDTIDTKRIAFSLFAHVSIYTDKLSILVSYNNYNTGGTNNNAVYREYDSQSIYYDQCTRQQLVTVAVDYAPAKNIHIIPNVMYNHYVNITPADYGSDNTGYDLIYRLTLAYQLTR